MKLATLADSEIMMTLTALACLLAGAFLMGRLFEKIQAPKVVGEIIGGMLFGGTFLGAVAPEFMGSIFNSYSEEGKVLNIFYQMGLSFLMFSSGYNTKIDLQKRNSRIFLSLFIGSTVLPMIAGLAFVKAFESYFIGTANSSVAFLLVFIIGIAITSIPVISKIFFDMGIINTRFANVVLTASTLQDLCLWILLNTAIDIALSEELNIGNMCVVIFLTLALFLLVHFIGMKLENVNIRIDNSSFMQLCFISLFAIVAVLSYLKINIMYSAFLTGYIIRSITNKDKNAEEKVKCITDFSFSFFVPVYFALVGIQLNLLHNFSLLRFIIFFALAFALEWIGTVILLLVVTKLRKKVVWNFGITMNARGGPGIVLATTAYNYGIINVEFFTVLILTTMLSSLIAGYWLRGQQRKDETIFENLIEGENAK
ncbi:MAG: cation:proton antiporter [Lachnospiraceae bacterium]|nr:cation:proton antiporter [Lachnospiraceae bacterium]